MISHIVSKLNRRWSLGSMWSGLRDKSGMKNTVALMIGTSSFLWYNSSVCSLTGNRKLDLFGPRLRDYSSNMLLRTFTNVSPENRNEERNVDQLTRLMMETFLEDKVADQRHPGYKRIHSIIDNILANNEDKNIIPRPVVHLSQERNQINAFSLANHIVISVNSLTLWSDSQLAFIVGHEMAHNILDHHMENVSWLVIEFFTAVLVLLISTRKLEVGILWLLLKPFRLFISYPVRRSGELAADDLGLDMMMKAGYDPLQVLQFWDIIEEKNPSNPKLWFLRDHPDHKLRREKVEQIVRLDTIQTKPE